MKVLTRVAFIGLMAALATAAAAAETLTKTNFALDAQNVREAECTAGDVLADAVRQAGKSEVAFVQANQLRQDVIAAGPVTTEALTGLLLYPNEHIVSTKLSGTQIREALERSLWMLPRPSTGFLQIAGLSLTYRSTQPAGGRVVEVQVAGAALDPDKTYTVAMPASLAKGDQGYFRVFQNLKTEEGPSIGEALVGYVRTGLKSAPQPDRIQDLSKPGH